MEYQFRSQDWQRITAAEKVSRCLLLAEETQVLADDAPPEIEGAYQRLADAWLKLAGEIERRAEEPKNTQPRPVIRCRCCRTGERDVCQFVEMGGYIFCDGCIEAASQIIGKRAARSA
jgi:hypothetical protein